MQRLLRLALTAWAFTAMLELACMALVPQSALRRAGLGTQDRVSVALFELLALAVFVLPLGALAARWPRLAVAGVGLFTTFSLAGWAGLGAVGMFLDVGGLLAWAAHPGQVFQWVPPSLVVAPPLAAGLAAWGLSRWLASSALVPAHWGLLGLVSMQGAWVATRQVPTPGEELELDEAGTSYRYGRASRYREAQRTAAGPFAHLLLELLPSSDRPRVSSTAQVTQPPLVSMARWLEVAGKPAHGWSVVVLTIESLRADRLRALGARREVMPRVDALAERSLVFPRAWTVAPETNDAAPAILSGQHPLRSARLTTYPQAAPYPRVFLYDVLHALGYRAGHFSSQDERWGRMDAFLRTEALEVLDDARGGTTHAGTRPDAETVDRALAWLPEQGPFFLSLNLQGAHFPYVLPAGARRRYGPEVVDFPLTYASWPLQHAAQVEGLYDDALGAVDTQVGRVLDALEARGALAQTVVVLTADHGEAFGEHGLSTHANALFEEEVRVPLLVSAPGLGAGTREVTAQVLDVPPTVLGLLGLPAHPAWQGLDLLGGVPPGREAFLVLHTPLGHGAAVVRGHEKLVLDLDSDEQWLFDLHADERERQNLVRQAPARAAQLKDRLDSFRALQLRYYGDPLSQAVAYPPRLLPAP